MNPLHGIDWTLLDEQRHTLDTVECLTRLEPDEREALMGVLNLLDDLSDLNYRGEVMP